MISAGLVREILAIQVRKILAYRADFWVSFLMTVGGNLAISYFLWRAIFNETGATQISGFGFHTLIFYYLHVPLVDRMVRGPELSFISQEIYDGTLSRYLVYPMGFFPYKFITFIAESGITAVQFLAAIGFYLACFGAPDGIAPSFTGFLTGFTLVIAAIVTYFLMASILECIAFWAENVWSVVFSLRLCIFFFGGGLFPLTMLPAPVQTALTYTPFPYFLSVPIRAFLGQLPFTDAARGLVLLVAWSGIFAIALRFIWRRGLKNFTGVGL